MCSNAEVVRLRGAVNKIFAHFFLNQAQRKKEIVESKNDLKKVKEHGSERKVESKNFKPEQ